MEETTRKDITPIWQSRRGAVVITDHNHGANPHYQISRLKTKNPEPDIWIDRNERVLNALIKKLEIGYIDRNKTIFRLVSRDCKYHMSLRRWLWEQYHEKTASKHAHIEVADGDIYNLMSYNLANTRDDCPNNDVRRIIRYGDYIRLEFRNTEEPRFFDVVMILDYEPELYDILCDRRLKWTYDKKKGIAKADYMYFTNGDKKSLINITISQIVIGFNYYGLRKSNMLKVLREMKESLTYGKLSIDHLDTDKRNNCKINLSVMPNRINNSKNDITSNIRKPYFLFAAYDGINYKIYCGIEYDNSIDGKYYLCENAEDLVEFLKTFYTSELGGTTPKAVYTANPNEICLAHYLITKWSKDSDAQDETYSVKGYHKLLALRPDEQFAIYRKGDVL